ncbi:MAG: flagellar protein FliS [Candidatus Poribacteria bacterium]
MQNPRDPSQQYNAVKIETSTDLTLILLAYDGIIRKLQNVVDNLGTQADSIEETTKELLDVLQIVDTLIEGLNFDEGEISLKLESFYQFVRDQLIFANMNKGDGDIDKVKEVIQLMEKVKTFWKSSRVGSDESVPSEPTESLSIDSLS